MKNIILAAKASILAKSIVTCIKSHQNCVEFLNISGDLVAFSHIDKNELVIVS